MVLDETGDVQLEVETHIIDGYVLPVCYAKTKKITEAVAAICTHCGMTFDVCHPFWAMSKSLAMHKKGLGHDKILLLRFQVDKFEI